MQNKAMVSRKPWTSMQVGGPIPLGWIKHNFYALQTHARHQTEADKTHRLSRFWDLNKTTRSQLTNWADLRLNHVTNRGGGDVWSGECEVSGLLFEGGSQQEVSQLGVWPSLTPCSLSRLASAVAWVWGVPYLNSDVSYILLLVYYTIAGCKKKAKGDSVTKMHSMTPH